MTALERLQQAAMMFAHAARVATNAVGWGEDEHLMMADEELRAAATAFDRSLAPKQRDRVRRYR